MAGGSLRSRDGVYPQSYCVLLHCLTISVSFRPFAQRHLFLYTEMLTIIFYCLLQELAVYREMLPTGGRAFSQSAPSYWIMDCESDILYSTT